MTPAKALRIAVALEDGVLADIWWTLGDDEMTAEVEAVQEVMQDAAKFLRAYANESIATMVAREENT